MAAADSQPNKPPPTSTTCCSSGGKPVFSKYLLKLSASLVLRIVNLPGSYICTSFGIKGLLPVAKINVSNVCISPLESVTFLCSLSIFSMVVSG